MFVPYSIGACSTWRWFAMRKEVCGKPSSERRSSASRGETRSRLLSNDWFSSAHARTTAYITGHIVSQLFYNGLEGPPATIWCLVLRYVEFFMVTYASR